MPFLTKASLLYPSFASRSASVTCFRLRVLQERSYAFKPLVGPHRPPSLDDLELDPIDQDDSVRTSPIFVNKPPPFNKNDYLIPSLASKSPPVPDARPSEAHSQVSEDYASWKDPNTQNDSHTASSAPLNTNNVSEEKARELCNILIEHLPPKMTKRELRALLSELDIKFSSIVKIQNGRAYVAVNGEHSLQRMLALDANLTLMQRKVVVTQTGPLKSSWRFTMDIPRNVTPRDIEKALQPLNVDILHNKKLIAGQSAADKGTVEKGVAQNNKGTMSKQSLQTLTRKPTKHSFGFRKFSTSVLIETDDDCLSKKGKRTRRLAEDTELDLDSPSEDNPRSRADDILSENSSIEHFESLDSNSPTTNTTSIAISDLPSSWEDANNSVVISSSEPTSTPTLEERLILQKALSEAVEHTKNQKSTPDGTSVPDTDSGRQITESENPIISVDDPKDDNTLEKLSTEAEQRLRLEKIRDDNLIYQLRVDGFGSQWRYKDLMSLIQEYEIDCSIPTGPQNGLVLMSVIGKHRFEKLFKMAGLEMLLKLTLISCSTTVADMLVSLEMAQLKQDHLLENLGINIGKIWPPKNSEKRSPSLYPDRRRNSLQMIVPQYRPDKSREYYSVHPDTLLNIPPVVPYHPPFPFADDDPLFGKFKESNKRSKPHENKSPRNPDSNRSSGYTRTDKSNSNNSHGDNK